MTLAQTLTIDLDHELESTRALLERVPLDDAHRGYQPHPKSMTLERLATHVAELPSWPKLALDSELFELHPGFEPRIAKSTPELLRIFDESVAIGRLAIDGVSDEDMQKNWSFRYGKWVSFTEVRTKVLRSFVNHLIHHRAQLGVYLRLNDIAIPGMYGPSADER